MTGSPERRPFTALEVVSSVTELWSIMSRVFRDWGHGNQFKLLPVAVSFWSGTRSDAVKSCLDA